MQLFSPGTVVILRLSEKKITAIRFPDDLAFSSDIAGNGVMDIEIQFLP